MWDGHRGGGIGTALPVALEAEAVQAGIDRPSLRVEAADPARRLAARLGYVEVSLDESGARMVETWAAADRLSGPAPAAAPGPR